MMQEQGFLARFLIALSPSLAGSRIHYLNDSTIDQNIHDSFRTKVKTGLRLMQEGFAIDDIRLSEDARKRKLLLHQSIEEELVLGGKSHNVKPYACKIVEQALRIGTTFSLFENIEFIEKQRPRFWMVSMEDFSRGIEVAMWYLDQVVASG